MGKVRKTALRDTCNASAAGREIVAG